MSAPEAGLIGDIGAMNARFALVQPDGNTTRARADELNDYPSLTDAIDACLVEELPPTRATRVIQYARTKRNLSPALKIAHP